MLKNSLIMQACQYPTLHLLYSKGVDSARQLLLCLIARTHSLFIPQFVSSAVNLILGVEIEKWMPARGTNIEYIDLVLQNKAGP